MAILDIGVHLSGGNMQLKDRTIAQMRLLNVDEYHQMANVGIFDPDERVELLEGRIWQQQRGQDVVPQ
ncbi:MAG: hypothetical protein ACKPCM_13995 [Pseudanabaena sp.]